MTFLNLSAYLFTSLDDPTEWIAPIRESAERGGLRGTVLLSREGINLTVAGPETGTREFAANLSASLPFTALTFKESWSSAIPFGRLKVRVKREIIRFDQDVHPERQRAESVSAQELARWIDEGEDILLLDARNRNEVACGTFRNAVHLDIESFTELPDALEQMHPDSHQSRVVTFCTGGVRCEKSVLWMKRAGFEDVRQLDGGVLTYFQETGGAHWVGDLFVFDERVAIDRNLRPVTNPTTIIDDELDPK